ncbi:MAG: class I adenylate-forming enzyme family protein [Pseudomonadota bacterium]
MQAELKQVFDTLTSSGQMFEISDVDVNGQSLKAWTHTPNSLRDVWAMAAGHADKDYLVYQDERWTYADAIDEVARIANWLRSQGVGQHDRVAIAMRNYPEWMLSYWATVSIGAVAVGMNAWWVPEEMAYALKDSSPKVLIADRERVERFGDIRADFPDITTAAVRVDEVPEWAHAWSAVLSADPEMPEVSIDPDDDASIFYTSGTTGVPKGAQLTHRGCCNNLMSLMFMNVAQGQLMAAITGEEAESPMDPGAPQVASIVATPLFHVTANNCLAQTVTIAGGKLVHMYKWDAGEALRLIEAERITTFTGVPVMSREMISHPDFATRDTSSLKALGGGGAPVHPDLVDKIDKSATQTQPSQGYGMTEVCGIISAAAGPLFTQNPASAGVLVPIFEAKIVDEGGNSLPVGETGELCVRGSQVIKGYLNRPEATAETIVNGWLHTGDIGYMDEHNFIYLVDRAKDMVLRGGENVYCSEVETAIFKHDAVAEAAVFAVPDERLGEEVGAAIFPVAGTQPSAEEIREFSREFLAAYKVPRYIWIVEQPLPRNASGKFVKNTLKESLAVADAG